MSIGEGWFPEEPEDEVRVLATQLLKSKLEEVFGLWTRRNKERLEREKNKK